MTSKLLEIIEFDCVLMYVQALISFLHCFHAYFLYIFSCLCVYFLFLSRDDEQRFVCNFECMPGLKTINKNCLINFSRRRLLDAAYTTH